MSTSNTYFNFPIVNPLKQQKQSRRIGGLLLMAVVALHGGLAWYLLNAPKTEQPKQQVIMEVVMLPTQVTQPAAKEPPPAAPPAQKEPEKPKPGVPKPPTPIKKPVVIKKPLPKPQPADIADIIPVPKFEPSPPTATQAPVTPSNSSATAKTADTSGQGHDADKKTVMSGVVPLVRVPPTYPSRAANRGIEGWVKVEFTIKPNGTVADAVVIQSKPEDVFDDAALTAINQWEFKPKIVNGVAVSQRAVQQLQFNLDR
jgi:protein TonB